MRARRSQWLGVVVAAAVVAATLASPGASAGPIAPTGPPQGGSRRGVHRHVIKIGLHVPLTGASPLPSDSMQRARNLFFRWLRLRHRGIHRRHVRVVMRNDGYNPSEAVAACKKMVEDDHVFALVGFTGIDQIRACARYAASAHVPYLAPGAAETGMSLPQTFTTTMTWPDASRLMADLVVSRLKGRRHSAIVSIKSATYKEGHDAFVHAMRARNAHPYSRYVATNANSADAQAVVDDLQSRGVKNVFVNVTPPFFLQMEQAAEQRGYAPTWTAIDQAFATDQIVSIGCGFGGNIDGARLLAGYPAFGDRDEFDEHFERAFRRFYPNADADSVEWWAWGQQKAIARLLRLPGRNLTRSRFVYFAERAKNVRTGVGPRLDFRPNDHFGADQAHLLRADCATKRWRTVAPFVDDF